MNVNKITAISSNIRYDIKNVSGEVLEEVDDFRISKTDKEVHHNNLNNT